ncbi:protein of unknown function [Streptantibioticus cattleyicolor NRRL 8057 = DSM 46488]|nr:protein of unknown function [Streptantibioticus cattleyicolor NRRL 8057 = DSM 46488]
METWSRTWAAQQTANEIRQTARATAVGRRAISPARGRRRSWAGGSLTAVTEWAPGVGGPGADGTVGPGITDGTEGRQYPAAPPGSRAAAAR